MKHYVHYKCRCPQCTYSYTISAYELPQGERCPICGHWGDFKEFLLAPPEATCETVRQAEEILAGK